MPVENRSCWSAWLRSAWLDVGIALLIAGTGCASAGRPHEDRGEAASAVDAGSSDAGLDARSTLPSPRSTVPVLPVPSVPATNADVTTDAPVCDEPELQFVGYARDRDGQPLTAPWLMSAPVTVTSAAVESGAPSPTDGSYAGDVHHYVLAGSDQESYDVYFGMPGMPPDLIRSGEKLTLSSWYGGFDLRREGKLVAFAQVTSTPMSPQLPYLDASISLLRGPVDCETTGDPCGFEGRAVVIRRNDETTTVHRGTMATIGELSVALGRYDLAVCHTSAISKNGALFDPAQLLEIAGFVQ